MDMMKQRHFRMVTAFLPLLCGTLPAATFGDSLPLFDAHIHYSSDAWDRYPVAEALAILDEAGIRRALVSSTPDDGTLRLFEAVPERVVPELRPYRSGADMGTWHSDPSILPYIEERLRRGIYRGIGEFHLPAQKVETPVVRRVVQLAVERGIPLHVHSDERAVAALFALEPRVKILWAHAGMSTPAQTVGEMLERFPNLWVELSYRMGEVAPDGRLSPVWRDMFLGHRDRFLFGSDTWSPERWPQVPAIANTARGWLGQLPPDVATAIASGNADRLYGEPKP
jgi:hypothetical protein